MENIQSYEGQYVMLEFEDKFGGISTIHGRLVDVNCIQVFLRPFGTYEKWKIKFENIRKIESINQNQKE